MSEPLDIRSCDKQELIAYMKSLGQPAFRARQLFRQAQKLSAPDFSAMTDLPLDLRQRLQQEARLTTPRVVTERISETGDTAKLLLEFADGERVEMALMLYRREQARDRATCCVSCQSGCAMGCRFCATGMFDRFRNLTAGEIVSQVQLADALARRLGFDGVSNLVYMGMGEPLANFENVRKSICLLNDEDGLNVGARRITVSTCGLVSRIYEMADWGLQVGLAVSLHAADNEKRRALMPGASRWTAEELIEACDHYRARTGRRVTCEYALIKGVNDSREDANKLAALLTGKGILVNIILANALPERGIEASGEETCAAFCRVLEKAGIEVQIRESRGRDIEAACGQLRKRQEEQAGPKAD